MANNCFYTMKVNGTKENREAWVKKMKDYDEPDHFYRIFSADVYDEDDDSTYISGDCAWSIETCCRGSGYSGGDDLLAKNTKDLGLSVEIWSEEPGMAFQEHYIYNKGECEADECVEFHEHYWDESDYPTFAEYVEDVWDGDCPVDEEDFDEEGWARVGGFDEYCNWNI